MISVSALPLSTLKVTSAYGPRNLDSNNYHWGTDYSAIHGQPVFAVQSGVVKRVETAAREYSESEKKSGSPSYQSFLKSGWGRYILIEHTEYGFMSLYAHLSSASVKVGDTVKAGQKIGTADDTGHSYGNHLHLEFINNNYSVFGNADTRHKYNVNPDPYLQQVKNAQGGQSASTVYDNVNGGVNPLYEDSYNDTVTVVEGSERYSGNRLFGRRYRIIVYDNNGNGIDVSEMRVVFNCHRAALREPPQGDIKIYNLNSATEGQIVQHAFRVTIEAGYNDLFGMIFQGQVMFVTRYKQNATDYVTELSVIDGDSIRKDFQESLTITRGMTKRQVLDTIINENGFPSAFNEKVLQDQTTFIEKYIRGKVIFGNSYDAIYEISQNSNAISYIEDGKIITTTLNDYAEVGSDQIIQLDYDSGLIGIPQEQEKLITFQALLNPKIKLMSFVRIKNEYIRELSYEYGATSPIRGLDQEEINPIKGGVSAWGVYKVISVTYRGDTRGNEWYVECDAGPQSGAFDDLLGI